MKIFLMILIQVLFFNPALFSAGWQALGYGLSNYATSMFIDTNNSKIYVSGPFGYADSIFVHGIAIWNGNNWDSLGRGIVYGGLTWAITNYQNQIYADGRFVLGSLHNNGGKFNGTTWDSLGQGVYGSIYQMKEINGALWVAGFYNTAGGNNCSMLSTWDGANWSCIYVPYENAIKDFIFYNNQLIIGGDFLNANGDNIDLALYDGSNFQMLNHPIYGNVSYINAMTIYKGDLYIGGYFLMTDGNEGNSIMRWDGTQWHDVGGGTDSRIECFKIYNNELYVGGAFQYAGGIHTGNLAKWDGIQWSKVTSSIISGEIYDMDFLNNELYIPVV